MLVAILAQVIIVEFGDSTESVGVDVQLQGPLPRLFDQPPDAACRDSVPDYPVVGTCDLDVIERGHDTPRAGHVSPIFAGREV
jgi:hypothetical protein